MSAAPQIDWFSQNAPSASSTAAAPQTSDWFSQNAPGSAQAAPSASPAAPESTWDKIKQSFTDNPISNAITKTLATPSEWAEQRRLANLKAAAEGKPAPYSENVNMLLDEAGTVGRMVGGLTQPKNLALLPAGDIAPVLTSAYVGSQGARMLLTPRQPNETTAQEEERRLMGASLLFGGGAGAEKATGTNPDLGDIGQQTAKGAGKAAKGTVNAILSPVETARKIINPFREQLQAKGAYDTAAENAAADSDAAQGQIPSRSGTRKALDSIIQQVSARERAAYDTLNKWAETDMKSLYDKRQQLEDALEDPTTPNPNELTARLGGVDAQIRAGEANVASHGGDAQKMLRAAKDDTQQRNALMLGRQKLFNDAIEGDIDAGQKEKINVNKAISNAKQLDQPSRFAPFGSPSRLEQMFGKKGAEDFLRQLYSAQRAGIRTARVAAYSSLLGGLYLLHRWAADKLLE